MGKVIAAPIAKTILVISNMVILEHQGDTTALAIRKVPIEKVAFRPILLAKIPAEIVQIPIIKDTIDVSQLTVVRATLKSCIINGKRGPGAIHSKPADNIAKIIIIPMR
jgi:hypothetical protein